VTREIVSGITLELTGRMRADGRITVNVDATVSKRGADVSATAGNPPPSSDKELHTTATVAPGKPVLLGELLTTDAATTSRRTPILSRIPLLGWLFRHRNQTTEKATTMLYLIAAPHTGSRQTRTAPLSQAERCMELYRALFPQASSVSGPEPQTLHRNHPRVEAPR
jgi:type II secretory pathway component GspD/PulD (secretin)